jgi:hypothetical protein
MCTKFWWGNLSENNNWKTVKTIRDNTRWILKTERVEGGWNWLRIVFSGRLWY